MTDQAGSSSNANSAMLSSVNLVHTLNSALSDTEQANAALVEEHLSLGTNVPLGSITVTTSLRWNTITQVVRG